MVDMRAYTETFDAAPHDCANGRCAAELLESLGDAGSGDRVYIRDMMAALQGRAFGMAALAIALPVCFPMPPGVPTVAGAALTIVAAQMAIGNEKLWLPKFIADKSTGRAKLKAAIARMKPRLVQVERFAKPRLLPLTSAPMRRLLGLVMLILAIMLVLPIPIFGNMPLGYAAAILALGLIERDGWFVLAGLFATVAAVAVTGSFALIAVRAVANFV